MDYKIRSKRCEAKGSVEHHFLRDQFKKLAFIVLLGLIGWSKRIGCMVFGTCQCELQAWHADLVLRAYLHRDAGGI
jgi:hypothetical protein